MGLFKWAGAAIKTFTMFDMAVFKICMIAFTLMIAKLVPAVLELDWYCYGAIFIVTYLWLLRRVFGKKL